MSARLAKQLARSILDRLGYEIRRPSPRIGKPIDVLDLYARSQLNSGTTCFLLQIGAHDGVMADPIRHLILRYQLPALLVEPLPTAFKQLHENYANQPQVRLENCAIDYVDGMREFFWIQPDENMSARLEAAGLTPDYVQGMAGFKRDPLLTLGRYVPNVCERLRSIEVATLSLSSLLSKHQITAVDVLQIDTEGYDFDIIKMAIDIEGLRPGAIRYEHAHLPRNVQETCLRLLNANGYRFLNEGLDTLAIRD